MIPTQLFAVLPGIKLDLLVHTLVMREPTPEYANTVPTYSVTPRYAFQVAEQLAKCGWKISINVSLTPTSAIPPTASWSIEAYSGVVDCKYVIYLRSPNGVLGLLDAIPAAICSMAVHLAQIHGPSLQHRKPSTYPDRTESPESASGK